MTNLTNENEGRKYLYSTCLSQLLMVLKEKMKLIKDRMREVRETEEEFPAPLRKKTEAIGRGPRQYCRRERREEGNLQKKKENIYEVDICILIVMYKNREAWV